jgi:hypothetical protein
MDGGFQMLTFMVQAILGERFEDIYVTAGSEAEAIRKAEQLTTLKSRWTRFVI